MGTISFQNMLTSAIEFKCQLPNRLIVHRLPAVKQKQSTLLCVPVLLTESVYWLCFERQQTYQSTLLGTFSASIGKREATGRW